MKFVAKPCPIFLAAGFLAAFATSATSQAVAGVVFGNLGADGSEALSTTNTDVTTNGRLALGFSTGTATERVVQSITLGLFYSESTTSSFSLSIFSDTGEGSPGSLFATSTPVTVGNTGKYTFPFANPTLQAGQAYWIVPEVGVSWYTNLGFTTPAGLNSSGYTYDNTLVSANGGVDWSNSGLTSYSVSVNAVPEPTTVGLLAAAGVAGGLALIRRRRG